jgi:hypothetical protein
MDSVTGQIREEHIHTPLRLSNRLGRGDVIYSNNNMKHPHKQTEN